MYKIIREKVRNKYYGVMCGHCETVFVCDEDEVFEGCGVTKDHIYCPKCFSVIFTDKAIMSTRRKKELRQFIKTHKTKLYPFSTKRKVTY